LPLGFCFGRSQAQQFSGRDSYILHFLVSNITPTCLRVLRCAPLIPRSSQFPFFWWFLLLFFHNVLFPLSVALALFGAIHNELKKKFCFSPRLPFLVSDDILRSPNFFPFFVSFFPFLCEVLCYVENLRSEQNKRIGWPL